MLYCRSRGLVNARSVFTGFFSLTRVLKYYVILSRCSLYPQIDYCNVDRSPFFFFISSRPRRKHRGAYAVEL